MKLKKLRTITLQKRLKMEQTKRPLDSWTLRFNVLSIVGIVIAEILAKEELREFLGGYVGVIMIAGTVVNVLLRFGTTMPIETKRKEPPDKTERNPLEKELEKDNDKILEGF